MFPTYNNYGNACLFPLSKLHLTNIAQFESATLHQKLVNIS